MKKKNQIKISKNQRNYYKTQVIGLESNGGKRKKRGERNQNRIKGE